MTLTHEDLLSISNLLDVKIQTGLQAELQPVKDSIRDLRFFIQSELELIKNDIRNLYAELQTVKNDIRNLYAELQTVKDDICNLYAELRTVKDDVSSLTYRVTRLELHIENVTDKNIQLLAENYVPAAKRYEKASARIDASFVFYPTFLNVPLRRLHLCQSYLYGYIISVSTKDMLRFPNISARKYPPEHNAPADTLLFLNSFIMEMLTLTYGCDFKSM